MRGVPAAFVRTTLVCLVVLSTPSLTATAPALADTAWTLHQPGTPPAPGPRLFSAGPTRLECGSYGVFEMDFAGFGLPRPAPTALASGREDPKDYPLFAERAPDGRLARTRGKAPLGNLANVTVPPPCDGGSCFGGPGTGPWVAVLDWNDWHGWSVAWTLLTASGGSVDAVLFPLDDPSLVRHFGPRVTDVHVLTQLCRLAEAVEQPGVSPPVAINLSFGRFHLPGDPSGSRCDPSTLACQIGRLIDHLIGLSTGESGLGGSPERSGGGKGEAGLPSLPNATLVAASAGNHRELLFPASYPSVISVGALDTQRLHKLHHADAAWETPRRVDALFPGHGLCLEYDTPYHRVSAFWPAPPGSSYATAFMAGWLAPSLAAAPLDEPSWGQWAPAADCRGRHCTWWATKGGRPVGQRNWAAQSLLDSSSPNGDSQCGEAAEEGVVLVRPLGDPIPWWALDALPYPQVSPQLHQPTPEPSNCVPCEDRYKRRRKRGEKAGGASRGAGPTAFPSPAPPDRTGGSLLERSVVVERGRSLAEGSAPGSPRASSVGDGGLTARTGAMRSREDALAVTLWAGQALDPGLSLDGVYLRLDSWLLPVQLGRRHLDDLAAGAVDVLQIELGHWSLSSTSQPSLVWVMRGPTVSGGEISFWTSTPILLRDR